MALANRKQSAKQLVNKAFKYLGTVEHLKKGFYSRVKDIVISQKESVVPSSKRAMWHHLERNW